MPSSFRHGLLEVKGPLTEVAAPPTLGALDVPLTHKETSMERGKAVQGMKREDAVKWTEGVLKKVYEA